MRTRTLPVTLAVLFAACVLLAQAPLLYALRAELLKSAPNSSVLAKFLTAWPALLGMELLAIIFLTIAASKIYLEWLARALANFWEFLEVGEKDNGTATSALHGFLSRLHDRVASERANHRRELVYAKANSDTLVRVQAELVAIDRLATVGRLAAGVAHEIGNPLTGIMGYISILRSRVKEDAESLEVLDELNREILRIDSTVRSLLDVGRPSRGSSQPVELRATIDAAVRLVAAGRLADVRFEVEAPTTLWVLAEGGPLAQALINILLNAVQAAGGGTIRVSATVEGERALLRVEDEGPGISDEVAPRLFEPFFTTRSPGQGTGLGLPMTKHLLAQFGATISAANRPEKGAVFTITLLLPPAV